MRLLALLFIAAALFAQSTGEPGAEWIRSPEPLKQAWGAHVIGEQKLTNFIPDLLRVLESPDISADADAAKFAVLDTLILLNAEVPPRYLEPLVDRFPTDVLILAAHSGEDVTDLLLKLLDRRHNREAFVAVGNLLTPKRNAGFAKAAMKEFCQVATVYVYNPNQPRGMGSAWAGDSLGKTVPPREEWPQTGSYRIYPGRGNPRQPWTLLADGPRPVSFVRTPNKGYVDDGFDITGEDSNSNSCIRAEEFLATYLETSASQLPIRSDAKLDLIWSTPEAFETAVRAFIAEQRVRFGLLAGALAARGYLTADEAAKARLNMRISAADARERDRTPLPDIDAWAKEPPR